MRPWKNRFAVVIGMGMALFTAFTPSPARGAKCGDEPWEQVIEGANTLVPHATSVKGAVDFKYPPFVPGPNRPTFAFAELDLKRRLAETVQQFDPPATDSRVRLYFEHQAGTDEMLAKIEGLTPESAATFMKELQRQGGIDAVRALPLEAVAGRQGYFVDLPLSKKMKPNDVVSWASRKTKDGVHVEVKSTGLIYVDGVQVTGGDLYDVGTIVNGLGYKDMASMSRAIGKRKVVSIAEGFSDLVPDLAKKGADIEGVDLWYNLPEYPDNKWGNAMREYVKKHGANLRQGSAFDLPYKNDSLDVVLSHRLINNVLPMGEDFMREVYRVLAPRGEARIAGFLKSDIPRFTDFLRKTYGTGVEFTFEYAPTAFKYGTETRPHESYVLVMKKAAKKPAPRRRG